jgi:AcrR family transcriptional regulator
MGSPAVSLWFLELAKDGLCVGVPVLLKIVVVPVTCWAKNFPILQIVILTVVVSVVNLKDENLLIPAASLTLADLQAVSRFRMLGPGPASETLGDAAAPLGTVSSLPAPPRGTVLEFLAAERAGTHDRGLLVWGRLGPLMPAQAAPGTAECFGSYFGHAERRGALDALAPKERVGVAVRQKAVLVTELCLSLVPASYRARAVPASLFHTATVA